MLGAYAAQGALVIFRQLVAFENIFTYSADILFHAVSPFFDLTCPIGFSLPHRKSGGVGNLHVFFNLIEYYS